MIASKFRSTYYMWRW